MFQNKALIERATKMIKKLFRNAVFFSKEEEAPRLVYLTKYY
jgi:hypothetical protein